MAADDDIDDIEAMLCCFFDDRIIELTNKENIGLLGKREEVIGNDDDLGHFSKKAKQSTENDASMVAGEDMEDFVCNLLFAISDSSEIDGSGVVGGRSIDLFSELEGLFGFKEMHQNPTDKDDDTDLSDQKTLQNADDEIDLFETNYCKFLSDCKVFGRTT